MNIKFFTTALVVCILSVVSIPMFAHAQFQNDVSNNSDSQGFQDGFDKIKGIAQDNELSGAKSSKEILQSIVGWLMSLLATIALIALLYGGYLYITSQGDESNVAKAKSIILYAVIGIILIGLSAVIVNVVISVATQ